MPNFLLPTRRLFFSTFVLLLASLLAPSGAQAQQQAASGFELALHGTNEVIAGKSARFRGMAYRVRGLSELQPFAARVRARFAEKLSTSGDWQDVRADASGFFQVDLPAPTDTEVSWQLEIRIGDGKGQRDFSFPVRLRTATLIDLVTDRALYEPGETIHVWTRVRDSQSRRPVVGSEVTFTLDAAGVKNQQHKTATSGVASTKIVLPKEAKEGHYNLLAHIDGRDLSRRVEIGTRSYERLFAEVSVSPEIAAPHQEVQVKVKVATASGALVRNAVVQVEIESAVYGAKTNADGIVIVRPAAPAYMTHSTGSVVIKAKVSHPAHGETVAFGRLGIQVPLTLTVEAVPSNGGLVPGLPGVLHVRLSKGNNEPAPVGTAVEVTGAAIAGGLAKGKSDVHGFVMIPTRLPRGGATGSDEDAMTTIIVHVKGDAPRTASIEVDVLRKAEVVPTVDKLVVVPGEDVTIRLLRRPSATKVPVIVELFSEAGLVEARKLRPGVNRLTMKVPMDKLGVFSVRARPLHQKAVVEGTGSVDAFLVRPPSPSFPSLVVRKKVYSVGTTANLTLQSAPGASKSWAAVLVRDLAAHSGEAPFHRHFLAKAFDKALLDPKAKASSALLRTALADHLYRDPSPSLAPPLLDAIGEEESDGYDLVSSSQRGVLRDPFPIADELKRRGVGEVMRNIEALLSESLVDGRLAEIATRRGGRSQFKSTIFEEFDEAPLTLGEGELSLEMLYAADPSFSYDNVGKRVARQRLIELLVSLAVYLDPGDDATPRQRAAAREPSDRWLPRMVERGLIRSEQLADPWGGSFTLRRSSKPVLAIAIEAANLELVSPGPDGKLGTRDDISDPFARAVPAGTAYAVASGEDQLMAQLARLAPGAEVLRRLLEAYQRVTAEVAEEEIGDAVGASVSEGWGTIGTGSYGTIGHGGGGGTGSGYGSGSGRVGGRSASAPNVRMGSATGGMSGFARVVRERFPSTLMFAPAIEVDPSGKTAIAIPLSEAITTHLVEVVVWSADGWTWSTNAKIRVDKETVVDAPVPGYATVGDVIRLPLRIGNRSAAPQKLDIALFTPGNSDRPLLEKKGVQVPAKDTSVFVVDLKLDRVMDGKITVGLRSPQGVALDAVRRPIRVQAFTRRVRKRVDLLGGALSGQKPLRLTVPKRASRREGSQVRVRVGAGIFALPPGSPGAQWARAWQGEAASLRDASELLLSGNGSKLASAIGVSWSNLGYADRNLADALRRLTVDLTEMDKLDDRELRLNGQVQVLLGIAPAIENIRGRPELATELRAIVRGLRKSVSAWSVQAAENPRLWAMSAAALSLSAPPNSKRSRVRELVRRVRRHQITVGHHTWVASKSAVHESSAYLALAELSLGERKRALALLRTLATLTLSKRQLSPWTRVLANLAAKLASPLGPPSVVDVLVDGKKRRVPLQAGIATIPAASLSRPGAHSVSLAADGSAPLLYHLEAQVEYGLPWDQVPALPGSLVASIEGKIGRLGEQSELELVVRNRSPRTIARPIVEMSVPAGAELDEEAKKKLRRHTRGDSEATRGTLRLELAGLSPGATRRIPIAFRWSVGGKLRGLGLAAFPDAKNEDVTVTQPRTVNIAAAKVAP